MSVQANRKFLVTTSGDVYEGAPKAVRRWEVESWNQADSLDAHLDDINRVAVSQNGQLVVTVSDDGTGRVWMPDAKISVPLLGHTAPVRAVALSPDARWAATGSDDTTVRLWDNKTGDNVIDERGV